MTDMLKVRTPAGYIRINPDEFFPNSSGNVRKLVKALRGGARLSHPDEGPAALLQLQRACREKLVKVEQCRKRVQSII